MSINLSNFSAVYCLDSDKGQLKVQEQFQLKTYTLCMIKLLINHELTRHIKKIK